MLYIKKANKEDAYQQWEVVTAMPADENGLINAWPGISFEEYEKNVISRYLEEDAGINLPEGFVPMTTYFLWDDDRIVGIYRLRQKLTTSLEFGPGHIGMGIRKEERGKGYAAKGLALVVEEAGKIIPEDEIYMSVHKDNPASLKAQQKCGAYIHHENQEEYFTRIPKNF